MGPGVGTSPTGPRRNALGTVGAGPSLRAGQVRALLPLARIPTQRPTLQSDGLCISDNQTPGTGGSTSREPGARQGLLVEQNTAPNCPGQPSCVCEYRCRGPEGSGEAWASERWATRLCVEVPGIVRLEGWVAGEGFGDWPRHRVP